MFESNSTAFVRCVVGCTALVFEVSVWARCAAEMPAAVDLELLPGQSLALVGGNGSGKTTLLRTIAGLLTPISGRLEVLGTTPVKAVRRLAWLGQ
ncbi:MAG: ATP-binding cassette domain-containing protein, partial [Burkholderiales bacterium]|nr:ATP-binding cassette domain-containing protein [Burkholderiales bacterium]